MLQALEWLKNNYGTILAIAGALGVSFEVGSQKIKPITAIMVWIGKRANASLYERMDVIEKKIDGLQKDFEVNKAEGDKREIYNIRKEIAQFSISCQKKEKHTPEDFERIFERIAQYHDLLLKYNLTNGKIDIETGYINTVYEQCLAENSFFEG